VQKDLVRDRGELELRLTRPWKPALAPDEPLTVKLVETPAGPLTPTVALTFELWDATECVGRWQTVARLRILREVWVAQTQLPRGRILRTDDFSLERRDLLSSRDPLLEFPAARPVLELAESLASGTVLCSRSLQARPVVRRGDVVEALLVEGSLSISLKVEALDNGAPGQSVRVRNLVSRRELRGKVRDEQTVLVSM
jgi:flagella basal body P-ring formation protein FlgA